MGTSLDSAGRVRAAGVVPWRFAAAAPGADPVAGYGGGIELGLVHRPRYDDWSWPKGKIDPGEHDLTTAAREALEETGLAVRLGRPLGSQRYPVDGFPKLVRYWAASVTSGSFLANDEVDAMDWVSPDVARERLTHRHDVALIDTLLAYPVDTVPLLLVRHALAGDRHSWKGDDRNRPLSRPGRQQAQQLVEPLLGFRPERVVSADLQRCADTVLPLADRVGLPVELDEALDEATNARDVTPAFAALRDVMGRGQATVLCSQGGVIPALLRRVAAQDGVALPQPLRSKKGSCWVLHVAAGQVVLAEYFRDLRAAL